MIGKQAWFQRRKYGGWGLVPKTWQGWAYIGVFVALIAGIQNIPGISNEIRFPVMYAIIGLLCLDILHIMATLKKDEMEVRIEALAERNAAWAMIVMIAVGISYQAAQSAISGKPVIDWFLMVILFAGLIAKAITNWWLEHKGV